MARFIPDGVGFTLLLISVRYTHILRVDFDTLYD